MPSCGRTEARPALPGMCCVRLGQSKADNPGCMVAGPSGIVVTDLLRKMRLLTETNVVKVVMIDTLHLFPETYDLMENAREFFGLHTIGRIFRSV